MPPPCAWCRTKSRVVGGMQQFARGVARARGSGRGGSCAARGRASERSRPERRAGNGRRPRAPAGDRAAEAMTQGRAPSRPGVHPHCGSLLALGGRALMRTSHERRVRSASARSVSTAPRKRSTSALGEEAALLLKIFAHVLPKIFAALARPGEPARERARADAPRHRRRHAPYVPPSRCPTRAGCAESPGRARCHR